MTAKPHILLVDDDTQLRGMLAEALEHRFAVQQARSATEALDLAAARPPAAVLTDIRMPGMDGLEFLERMHASHPDVPIVVLSGYPDKESLMRAFRHQAFDYLEKPVDFDLLTATMARAVESHGARRKLATLRQELDRAKVEVESRAHALRELYREDDRAAEAFELPASFQPLLTQNREFRARLAYGAAIAGTSLPVLIVGETGTGKDVVARALHAASKRTGLFVAANIGGLDDALFADTLFGHVAGAFTNADKSRAGLIQAADGGTLFLDEIGDLSATSQVKLLRLLEGGEYYPLGSDTVRRANARIIAATHRDIASMVNKGAFRSDLYFRLKAHLVQLPPLRDRQDDLALLLDHFMRGAAHQLAKPVPTYPKELLLLLAAYAFPGNVRELRSMVFDAVSRHSGTGMLSMRSFQDAMEDPSGTAARDPTVNFPLGAGPLPTLQEAEDRLVDEALRRAEGNQTAAARMLGLTRHALNKRLSRARLKRAG